MSEKIQLQIYYYDYDSDYYEQWQEQYELYAV